MPRQTAAERSKNRAARPRLQAAQSFNFLLSVTPAEARVHRRHCVTELPPIFLVKHHLQPRKPTQNRWEATKNSPKTTEEPLNAPLKPADSPCKSPPIPRQTYARRAQFHGFPRRDRHQTRRFCQTRRKCPRKPPTNAFQASGFTLSSMTAPASASAAARLRWRRRRRAASAGGCGPARPARSASSMSNS